jgi:hypothetical protein
MAGQGERVIEVRVIEELDQVDRTLDRNSAAIAQLRDEMLASLEAIGRLGDRIDGGEPPA